jgi:3-oxoacyl-[acyl-carrier protein] reductase
MEPSKSGDELIDKTAVITGSSSGIGRAIAEALAAGGCACVIHAARSRESAAQVAAEIRRLGRESLELLADFEDTSALETFFDSAWKWRNGIDIWVNNAGADVLTGEASRWPFDRKLDVLWSVDVRATVALSRLVGQAMKVRGTGTILNIGWDQAEWGMAGDSGELFAATKGAVMAFTRSLARSLAPEVRVNCVAPGWIKTAWGSRASSAWQERAQKESLLGRWGTADDVARVVRFLAGPNAGLINGQVLAVNGGFRTS